jgi:hypothetical protein
MKDNIDKPIFNNGYRRSKTFISRNLYQEIMVMDESFINTEAIDSSSRNSQYIYDKKYKQSTYRRRMKRWVVS